MMEQIYIEWRDAVGKSHLGGPGVEAPHSVLLRGTAWLIEETETDVIVAAYLADDGGCMDMVAIPRTSIEKQEPQSSSGSGQQTKS